jgi:four helix bundle protein
MHNADQQGTEPISTRHGRYSSCKNRGVREPNDLVPRVRQFALASIRFVERLPKTSTAQVLGRQYLRSSTSVNSNYKAAKRGRSTAEFISKLGVVVEEIDESVEWLEVLRDAEIAIDPALLSEAQQLRRIFGKSLGTARRNHAKRNKKRPPDSPAS